MWGQKSPASVHGRQKSKITRKISMIIVDRKFLCMCFLLCLLLCLSSKRKEINYTGTKVMKVISNIKADISYFLDTNFTYNLYHGSYVRTSLLRHERNILL